MERPTMRSMRDNFDAIAINKTGLANDQCHKRRILEREFNTTGNLAIASVLNQQNKLLRQQKSAKQHSIKPRKLSRTSNRPRRKDFNSPEGFNEMGIATGRSYASRAGERMEGKQKGFPDVMRHPTTISNMIVPLNTSDVKERLDTCRPRMRDAFSNFSYGAQISGGFQLAIKTAKYLATIFPASELPKSLDPVNRPDELFALLHWHGVIADPHLSKQEVRGILKNAYPGCRRVCVAKVQPDGSIAKVRSHTERRVFWNIHVWIKPRSNSQQRNKRSKRSKALLCWVLS